MKTPKKIKKKLQKINKRERDRLGSSNVVRTKHFKYGQTLGKASEVRHITVEQYLKEKENND